jgi:hypothetical protein
MGQDAQLEERREDEDVEAEGREEPEAPGAGLEELRSRKVDLGHSRSRGES